VSLRLRIAEACATFASGRFLSAPRPAEPDLRRQIPYHLSDFS